MGSLGCAHGSSGSFEFACVHAGEPRGLRVYSNSRGFTHARIVMVGFIGFRVGSLRPS